MDDSAKYLIHADITADGVVERSDVVGAVFGQTEGLLGDELDLRDLQQSSKVGRIDVQIASENGRSHGEITIASSLDKVETSILAASLETIDRVGPCKSDVVVTEIEDVRAAKRREVVERAKELLSETFDESIMTSQEILEEVKGSVRVEDITEYRGMPAGPRVEDADAIIVVEGRADVLTLLRYGVKNAIAVEGTNVPDSVAELTQERTVTAFLDGDRGGELILRELQQVGDVDYVTFAPEGRSVEDLARHDVMSALREKVPVEELPDRDVREVTGDVASPRTAPSETTDGAAEDDAAAEAGAEKPAEESENPEDDASARTDPADATGNATGDSPGDSTDGTAVADGATTVDAAGEGGVEPPTAEAESPPESASGATPEGPAPSGVDADRGRSLGDHVREVIDGETGRARLLDRDLDAVSEVEADEVFAAVEGAESTPYAVVLDAGLDQRVLDVAAQRGVDHVVARSLEQFVKKPVDVRVRTADQLLERVSA
ncbi:MAG: DNA primase DnaG [Haloferacaceae archaeon]